jgi:threonylcarbamoyladenosine tRNA methylthiotransferase CDKAL1
MEQLKGKRIHIESYGCTYNHADTQKLKALLEGLGCSLVGPDEAEAVIINTCTVVGSTERQMLRRLAAFADRELYVTGCMPLVQMEKILSVCSPRIIHPDEITERYGGVGTPASGAVGVVQVACGCVGQCSYCITRLARGPLRSAPVGAILEAVRNLARNGACEIQLTGQDVAAWGIDRGESLPELLAQISRIPGNFAVRLGMMHPASVLRIQDDLVEAYAGDHIFRFLHLPVQSGSDAVLEGMRRGYRDRRRVPGTVSGYDDLVRLHRWVSWRDRRGVPAVSAPPAGSRVRKGEHHEVFAETRHARCRPEGSS